MLQQRGAIMTFSAAVSIFCTTEHNTQKLQMELHKYWLVDWGMKHSWKEVLMMAMTCHRRTWCSTWDWIGCESDMKCSGMVYQRGGCWCLTWPIEGIMKRFWKECYWWLRRCMVNMIMSRWWRRHQSFSIGMMLMSNMTNRRWHEMVVLGVLFKMATISRKCRNMTNRRMGRW